MKKPLIIVGLVVVYLALILLVIMLGLRVPSTPPPAKQPLCPICECKRDLVSCIPACTHIGKHMPECCKASCLPRPTVAGTAG